MGGGVNRVGQALRYGAGQRLASNAPLYNVDLNRIDSKVLKAQDRAGVIEKIRAYADDFHAKLLKKGMGKHIDNSFMENVVRFVLKSVDNLEDVEIAFEYVLPKIYYLMSREPMWDLKRDSVSTIEKASLLKAIEEYKKHKDFDVALIHVPQRKQGIGDASFEATIVRQGPDWSMVIDSPYKPVSFDELSYNPLIEEALKLANDEIGRGFYTGDNWHYRVLYLAIEGLTAGDYVNPYHAIEVLNILTYCFNSQLIRDMLDTVKKNIKSLDQNTMRKKIRQLLLRDFITQLSEEIKGREKFRAFTISYDYSTRNILSGVTFSYRYEFGTTRNPRAEMRHLYVFGGVNALKPLYNFLHNNKITRLEFSDDVRSLDKKGLETLLLSIFTRMITYEGSIKDMEIRTGNLTVTAEPYKEGNYILNFALAGDANRLASGQNISVKDFTRIIRRPMSVAAGL